MITERGGTSEVRVELRRAPLVPVAGALMVGIVAGRFLPVSLGFWAVLAGAGAAMVAVGLWRPHLHGLAVVAMCVAVTALGAVAVGLDYFAAGDGDILACTGAHDILATVRGQIVSTPTVAQDDPPPAYGYRRPPQTQFLLQAQQIRKAGGWLSVRGRVGVTIHEADDRLAAGQQVEVMGWLGRAARAGQPRAVRLVRGGQEQGRAGAPGGPGGRVGEHPARGRPIVAGAGLVARPRRRAEPPGRLR